VCVGILGNGSLEEEEAMVDVISTLKDGNNLGGLGTLGDVLLSDTWPYKMSVLVPSLIKLENVGRCWGNVK
jgi:hypothetical protein